MHVCDQICNQIDPGLARRETKKLGKIRIKRKNILQVHCNWFLSPGKVESKVNQKTENGISLCTSVVKHPSCKSISIQPGKHCYLQTLRPA